MNIESGGFDIVVDDDATERLLRKYLTNRRSQSGELKRALSAGDFEFIKDLGHRLVGSGGAYGMPRLTAIGARLEEYASLQSATDLSAPLREYDAYVHNVRIVRRR